MSLIAASLTAAVGAGCFSWHLCQFEHAVAARLQSAVAVLSQPAVAASSRTIAVAARWRLPDETGRSGLLTTATAPAVYHAPAPASLQVPAGPFRTAPVFPAQPRAT